MLSFYHVKVMYSKNHEAKSARLVCCSLLEFSMHAYLIPFCWLIKCARMLCACHFYIKTNVLALYRLLKWSYFCQSFFCACKNTHCCQQIWSKDQNKIKNKCIYRTIKGFLCLFSWHLNTFYFQIFKTDFNWFLILHLNIFTDSWKWLKLIFNNVFATEV